MKIVDKENGETRIWPRMNSTGMTGNYESESGCQCPSPPCSANGNEPGLQAMQADASGESQTQPSKTPLSGTEELLFFFLPIHSVRDSRACRSAHMVTLGQAKLMAISLQYAQNASP